MAQMRMKKRTIILLILATLAAVSIYFTYPPSYEPISFPDGKKFAFAIIDDTDGATVQNVKPVYDFLYDLGMRSTKTVWVWPTNDPEHWPNRGETLADSDYVAFLMDIQSRGFEIALHGARGGNSTRVEIIEAFERFKTIFGQYPTIHINHSQNIDNLYWGSDKLSVFPFPLLYNLIYDSEPSFGHDPESEHFWGDIAKRHIRYVVNFSFQEINILKVNPLVPYHDDRKPYVNYWLHSSDGGVVESFSKLISKENVDRLERENGVCFVYTHLASGFFRDGAVDSTFRERMTYLASKDGWFAPASEILDYIRSVRGERTIGFRERVYIELRWLREKVLHGSR